MPDVIASTLVFCAAPPEAAAAPPTSCKRLEPKRIFTNLPPANPGRFITDFDDPTDMNADPRPNALVLYNPGLDSGSPSVIHNLAAQWGKAVADHARDFSPIDHLDRGLPPTIIFQGTADKLVSPATAEDFCMHARTLKAQCEVVLYPGAPHGFTEIWLGLEDASLGLKTEAWAADTSRRTDAFLTSLGWLPPR